MKYIRKHINEDFIDSYDNYDENEDKEFDDIIKESSVLGYASQIYAIIKEDLNHFVSHLSRYDSFTNICPDDYPYEKIKDRDSLYLDINKLSSEEKAKMFMELFEPIYRSRICKFFNASWQGMFETIFKYIINLKNEYHLGIYFENWGGTRYTLYFYNYESHVKAIKDRDSDNRPHTFTRVSAILEIDETETPGILSDEEIKYLINLSKNHIKLSFKDVLKCTLIALHMERAFDEVCIYKLNVSADINIQSQMIQDWGYERADNQLLKDCRKFIKDEMKKEFSHYDRLENKLKEIINVL